MVGSEEVRWERAWRERRFATSSVASLAAFMARVLGMARSEVAKAAIASCSREPCLKVSCSLAMGLRSPTYHGGSPFFKIDVQSSLDCASTWHDTSTLKRALDS